MRSQITSVHVWKLSAVLQRGRVPPWHSLRDTAQLQSRAYLLQVSPWPLWKTSYRGIRGRASTLTTRFSNETILNKSSHSPLHIHCDIYRNSETGLRARKIKKATTGLGLCRNLAHKSANSCREYPWKILWPPNQVFLSSFYSLYPLSKLLSAVESQLGGGGCTWDSLLTRVWLTWRAIVSKLFRKIYCLKMPARRYPSSARLPAMENESTTSNIYRNEIIE